MWDSVAYKEYNRLLEILKKRKSELQDLGKSSLEECFLTRTKVTQTKICNLVAIFFRRKSASLTEAQKEELAKWEAEICVDSVAYKEYNRLLEILKKRKSDLQDLGKSSLEECFLTNKSNTDKDLQFGRNFFPEENPRL